MKPIKDLTLIDRDRNMFLFFRYERLGHVAKAHGDYSTAIIHDPKSAISYHARAILNANRGAAEAVNDFDIAISIEPENPLYVASPHERSPSLLSLSYSL